jgi:WD40 repeat protein/DNA-binding SARP family transcriptional activator
MRAVGIAVLGPLRVDGEVTSLGPRDRVVLETLAVRPGDVVSAERLADALWAETVPATWPKVVQGCVVRLRKVLGAEAIETSPQGYRLALPADDIDAGRFERLVRRSHELLVLGEHERAAYVSGEALALWRGPPFSELDGWESGRIEARRLEELRLDAEEVFIDAGLRAGRHRDVLGLAEARAAEAPLRERRWALLAVAQYQAGRQGDALRSLRQARRVLVAELGLDPGPELVALEQAILRQDPSLAAAVALPEANATCPYRGLLPYDVGDADTFHGRDDDVTFGLERLASVGALAVVGPSGGGKSSLVRAGIAATLQRQGRHVRVFSPGAHPEESFIALGTVPAGTVLVVDQCEEVFTLCDDAAERTRFLDALIEHAVRGSLVVALRADRLGDLAAHPAFARLVERSLHLLGAMDDAALRAAIEAPARQYGLLLESGLVDVLVGEVEGEPGALPLLSHALRETWVRRQGRTLTVEGYRESGGIRSAVARSAERVYEQIDQTQRPLLRDLMLRLVTPIPDGDPVRARIARHVFATDDERERLIETLVAARLVTSDERMVELAHESLVRAWPRLRDWLDDDVEGQRILRHLAAAGQAWDAMGRPDTELYRGQRLAQAVEWRERASPDLNPVEREFLAAAEAAADRERLAAEERTRHQARVNRTLRTLLVGVGAALVVAIVAGMLAVRQADRADRTAEVAEREAERADRTAELAEREAERADRIADEAAGSAAAAELAAQRADRAAIEADARRVGTQALVTENVDESLLMAVAGVRLDDSSDTRANLLTALTRNPALVAATRSPEPLVTVDASFDGKVVAVGDEFTGIAFHDPATLALLGSFPEPSWTLKFRPGGTTLAMSASAYDPNGPLQLDPMPVVIVDTATFQLASTQLGGQPERAFAWSLEYSADGRYLAAAFELYGDDLAAPTGAAIAVWDLEAPDQPVRRFDAGSIRDFGWWHGLSPDGALLYTGGRNIGSVVVRDVATGTVVDMVAIAHTGVEASPDGAVLAVADGRDVVLLETKTLTEQGRLDGHANVTTLQFSRDGTYLATGTEDGAATLWDIDTGAVVDQFRGHSGIVMELAFSPDRATLYTVSLDRSLLAWDLDGSRRFVAEQRAPTPPAYADYAFVAAGGELIGFVTGLYGKPAAMQFLDFPAGEMGPQIALGHGEIGDVRLRPLNLDEVATTGRDGFVRIWQRSTGSVIRERDVGGQRLAYSADGERIFVGAADGEVSIIDADTLEPLAPSILLDHGILGLHAAPDNRTAIALTGAPGIAIVDTIDGTVLHERRIELSPISADFSPDGERAAVATQSGEVGVLDLSTAEWVREPIVGHRDTALTVRYSPDGNVVVSGGLDGRVAMWDGNTGALLGSLLATPNVATAAGFAPDGHTVVIASTDGTVARWDTRVEHWISAACRIAGRSLTAEEWAAILPHRPYVDSCS